MRHAPSTLHFSHMFQPFAGALGNGAIEWEELPSFAASIGARRSLIEGFEAQARHARGGGAEAASWRSSRPLSLDTVDLDLGDALAGVVIQERDEPGPYQRFFGA